MLGASDGRRVIGSLLRSIDFERVLRTRSRAAGPHFAVHHLAGAPTPYVAERARSDVPPQRFEELSTGVAPTMDIAVDEFVSAASSVQAAWLGTVVPKRHARRAVTRTLLKRQIRSVALGESPTLAAGLWVVRLRAPFDRAAFPSAASDALRRQARAELQQLFAHAFERLGSR